MKPLAPVVWTLGLIPRAVVHGGRFQSDGDAVHLLETESGPEPQVFRMQRVFFNSSSGFGLPHQGGRFQALRLRSAACGERFSRSAVHQVSLLLPNCSAPFGSELASEARTGGPSDFFMWLFVFLWFAHSCAFVSGPSLQEVTGSPVREKMRGREVWTVELKCTD